MPPKSSNKKQNLVSWFHCETCEVHITTKDREIHEQVCPIAKNAVKVDPHVLEYIRDDCLYTASVERLSLHVEELQELPAKFSNNIVYISEGAMRLANFHIGQHVVIRAPNQPNLPPLVRLAWPLPEKFLTTIFITEEDLKFYWKPFKDCVLKIEKMSSGGPTPAHTVMLQLQEPLEEFTEVQLIDVEHILRQHLKNLVFTRGNIIYYNFYNKILKFNVHKWSSFDNEIDTEINTLEVAMDKLNLQRDQEEFFQFTTETSIKIQCKIIKNYVIEESTKPVLTIDDIGGLDEQLQEIEQSIDFALGFKSIPKGIKLSRGILLYGSSGCGKTMICEAMCSRVLSKASEYNKTYIRKINPNELFSKYLGETEKNLSTCFEQAFANFPQPTLIIIEDVHNLCPQNETNEIIKRVSVSFLSILSSLSSKREAQRVFVLATTSQISHLNAAVRRCGRLDCEIEIGVPTPQGRADILHRMLRSLDHNLTSANIEEVANVTHAFVGADLANLIYNATMQAVKSHRSIIQTEDLLASLAHVKPSAMREVLIENPNVHWSDIGGQADLKLKLQQAIEWPLQYPEKFKRLGIKPPRGVLMFGPPGCSKTMIAKALATESSVNFLSIKGPELFSMWVGESERAVREVFRKARQVAPAIVFFDEIDAISGERADNGSGTSVKERVLTQLLTEMDGVEALQNVTIVAATNRPDMIDNALLRPGRIDRIIYVGLPDADARREIFRIKLSAMPIAEDVIVNELVENTDGYSGAEIQAVCHEAALKTLEESYDAEHVKKRHFIHALEVVKPRTSPELLAIYHDYLNRS